MFDFAGVSIDLASEAMAEHFLRSQNRQRSQWRKNAGLFQYEAPQSEN